MRQLPCLAAALSLLVLAACDKGAPDANWVEGNATGALANRIMVDPRQLAGGPRSASTPTVSKRTTPAEQLSPAPPAKRAGNCPECDAARRAVTLAAVPQQPGTTPVECTRSLTFAADWARRLPPDLPLYPQARVTEAAGSEESGCHFRVVSFTVDAPVAHMVHWYHTRATRAGFTSGHQLDGPDHVLAGSRARDGGVYVLFLSPDGPRTSIDMVVNKGV
jgi:hypothetical protein